MPITGISIELHQQLSMLISLLRISYCVDVCNKWVRGLHLYDVLDFCRFLYAELSRHIMSSSFYKHGKTHCRTFESEARNC